MNSSVDLSVVIVTYKSKEYISQCIRSVYEATQGLRTEIIVVDNASGDGLADIIHIEFPQVIVIENDKNEGFARGVNRGASIASGRYLNILNPDTRFYPETLKILLDFLEGHPLCCVAGARTIDEMGKCIPSCCSLPHITNLIKYPLSLLLRGKRLKKPRRYLLDIWEQNKTIDLTEYDGYITGACMLTKLDFFKKLGMFDERFFLCAEDTDFGLCIVRKGFHPFFVAEASLVHFEGRSISKNPQSCFYAVDAYLRYIHKNFNFIHGVVYKTCLSLFVFGETLWAFLRMKWSKTKYLLQALLYLIHYWSIEPPEIAKTSLAREEKV